MKVNDRREASRNDIRTILNNLDSRWLRAASLKVCENLSSLINSYYPNAGSILAWTSFFKGEPDLSDFIARQIVARKVFLPRSMPDLSMDFIPVNDSWQEELQSGIFGIPEPKQNNTMKFNSSHEQNLILVPGLVFDKSGNRLGRGKGYYDRFLSRPENKNLIKIGVCLSLQIFDTVDAKPHDVPVNWICTEEGMLKT